MNKDVDDLLKLIKKQLYSEKGDLAKVRRDFDEFYLSFSSRGPMKITSEPDSPVPSYWIVTPHSSYQKVILFFHGGGFNRGSTYGHQDLCQRLSRYTGFSVFSVDYSLAPENPFPAAIEDCIQSYLWLLDEGFKSSDLVIAGISAGGNLTLSTLLALKKIGEKMPLGGICMSPVVDFTFPVTYTHLKDVNDWINYEQLDKIRNSYLNGQKPTNPLVSPIYGDLKGLPPLMMQVGSHELLLCDINRFRDLAVENEVKVNLEVWQNMFHSWQLFYSHLPGNDGPLRSIGEFVKDLKGK
ncbi:alpha/beta hydrolase [Methanobacterium formicicum]|uniref:Alpha/beta hydrolase domain-containing protein n=1 Tax=Methanobacterium formicicum (strain DSM 3637 / PP1) TaxID=1204725 RepID=K2R1V7_METFP|nr:alpha/beta hydrolase [Methanobacterium formicicum]EKF85217.1 alpha/beta hydrolase domain-containing protein [Methanobacterium formicicum DSM 3637]